MLHIQSFETTLKGVATPQKDNSNSFLVD